MFILTEDTQDSGYNVELEELKLVGDAEELAAMGVELAESYSMLQLGFARLEAKAIREHAGEGVLSESTEMLLEEGKDSFFKSAKEFVKKYWGKLVSFLKSVVEKIKNFFASSEALVRKNRDALSKLTDADLKSLKFDRVHVIAEPGRIGNVMNGAESYGDKMLSQVESKNEANFKASVFELGAGKAMGISGDAARADSLSAGIKAYVNGVASKDAIMTAKDVKNALQILTSANGAAAILKDAQKSANTAIKIVESRAKLGISTDANDKTTESNKEVVKTLNNIKALSPRIGGMYSAALSALATSASNARSVVNKALTKVDKTKKDEVQNADGIEGILARFM